MDSKTSELKISVKLFRDDTEKAVSESGNPGFTLPQPNAFKNVSEILTVYFSKYFIFYTVKKQLSLTLLGYGFEEDAVWFYLRSEPAKRTPRIGLKVDLLCAQFPDQIHLVSFTKDAHRESVKLNCSDNQASFEIK